MWISLNNLNLDLESVYSRFKFDARHFNILIFIPDPNFSQASEERKKEIIAIQYLLWCLSREEEKNLKKLSFFNSLKKERKERRNSEDKREKSNIGHHHWISEHNSLKFDQFEDLRCLLTLISRCFSGHCVEKNMFS